MNKIEITSPAGSWESLMAAIKAGADSIYFGVDSLNMRHLGAKNFKISDLNKITKICKQNNIKSYLTLNSLIYDNDIKKAKNMINHAKKAEVNAIIAFDISVMEHCKKIKMPCCASTQCNITNTEAVKFYANYCDIVVLARELNLKQISLICNYIKNNKIKGPSGKLVKVELFIHGALCISISGKCGMSLHNYNRSANRGECLQTCRRAFKVTDLESNQELKIDNQYIMSPSDLCTLPNIDEIISSGVSILKIEGRARPPEYVYNVTKAYKTAVTLIKNNTFTQEKKENLLLELKKVFNRGFWQGGYYLGKKTDEWSEVRNSKATERKKFIGSVTKYYPKSSVAILNVRNSIKKDSEVYIIGKQTGIIRIFLKEIYKNGKPVNEEVKGEDISIKTSEKVKKGDEIYLIEKTNIL